MGFKPVFSRILILSLLAITPAKTFAQYDSINSDSSGDPAALDNPDTADSSASNSSASSENTVNGEVPLSDDSAPKLKPATNDPLSELSPSDARPSATSVPVQNDAPQKKGPLTSEEIFTIASDMAEINYAKSKSQRTLSELVASYEKLIDLYCASSFRLSTAFDKRIVSPKCTELTEKTLKLDPENPVAICGRDGIKSKQCVELFARQEVGGLDNSTYLFADEASQSSGRSSTESFQLELQMYYARVSAETNEVNSKLQILENVSMSTGTADSLEKLRAAYNELLDRSCKLSKLRLVPSTQRRTIAGNFFNTSSGAKAAATPIPGSVEDLLHQYEKAKATPTPLPGVDPLIRLRLLGTTCQTNIQRVLQRFSDHAFAICYRDSWNSPNCINALENEKKRIKSTPKGGETPESAPKSDIPADSNLGTF